MFYKFYLVLNNELNRTPKQMNMCMVRRPCTSLTREVEAIFDNNWIYFLINLYIYRLTR